MTAIEKAKQDFERIDKELKAKGTYTDEEVMEHWKAARLIRRLEIDYKFEQKRFEGNGSTTEYISNQPQYRH